MLPNIVAKVAITSHDGKAYQQDRFYRQADTCASGNKDCILIIENIRIDVTSWARAHPGGEAILQKYHGKDATKVFKAVGHSEAAYELLKKFRMKQSLHQHEEEHKNSTRKISQWIKKLFTKEDQMGIHKVLGLFCLCHFTYRFYLMLCSDDLAAGFGSLSDENNPTAGASILPFYCLIPHIVLSLSSLLFHTVPRERVAGKPMIWQEFRAHNIIFGLRSLLCSVVSWASIYYHHRWRMFSVCLSCLIVLGSCRAADIATAHLRHDPVESTTATMPYWEGCSFRTQYWFKQVYALAQFGATITCLLVSNPAWPLSVLLPIQGASFLMTLVRKGLISARTYHVLYSLSLLSVFFVGLRYILCCLLHFNYLRKWDSVDLFGLFILALITFQLRRSGWDKYVIWISLVACRIAVGDQYIHWRIW